MTETNDNKNRVYAPKVGIRNHQFADVEDICELREVMNRAHAARVNEVMKEDKL